MLLYKKLLLMTFGMTLICNSTFVVMDTVTEHLLHIYVSCVSLSSIVYMGTRKRAE